MEIRSIERNREIKINTEYGAILLSYNIKMKIVIQHKELEITKTLTKQLLFDYGSEEAIKQLAEMEHEMYELERKAEKSISNMKEIFMSLEQIIENHGYKII